MEITQNYAIGKRKTSIAKIFFKKNGTNQFIVNNKIKNFTERELTFLKKPFFIVNFSESIDIIIKVIGGGVNAQLEAIFLGICKALSLMKNEYREKLSKNGFLRRDSRIKERRKYGLKKARKASQFSKR